MISKVTRFSRAIVNIFVSPIPVGVNAQLIFHMVVTHFIVQGSTVDVEQVGGGGHK